MPGLKVLMFYACLLIFVRVGTNSKLGFRVPSCSQISFIIQGFHKKMLLGITIPPTPEISGSTLETDRHSYLQKLLVRAYKRITGAKYTNDKERNRQACGDDFANNVRRLEL